MRTPSSLRALSVFLAGLTAALAAAVPGAAASATALPTGPVMGYNTWYQFGAAITEARVMQQASELRSSGLAAAGYDVVVLDAGWAARKRAGHGAMTWNPAKFPHGIPWLAARLHAMGLRLGVYTAIGATGCGAGVPGSYGHYAADAAAFASWGVSFVKVDDCKGLPSRTSYAEETALFEKFGRSISGEGMIYSEELPVLQAVGSANYRAGVAASSRWANMWRVAPDERWTDSAAHTILGHLADDLHLYGYARPGHWNDLDMLVPGNPAAHPFRWTLAEEETQMSVWAQEASPLLISADIGVLSPAELAALENQHMIAIDQSGRQASVFRTVNHVEAVIKQADGGTAVLFANLGASMSTARFTLAQLGIKSAKATGLNVWSGRTGTLGAARITLGAGQAALYVMNPA